MRGLLLVAALLLGGAVSAAADMSGLSFANAHPALGVSKSKPSLLVRDASGLPVHQPLRVTEKFTDPVHQQLKATEEITHRAPDVAESRLEDGDLENLHETRASALSDPIASTHTNLVNLLENGASIIPL